MNLRTAPIKILHILDHGMPLQSGYVFRTQNIFREQVKRGWLPIAITSPKHEASTKEPWRDAEEKDGVRYYRTRLTSPTSLPLQNERRIMRALAQRIQQVVEKEKPEVLHAHSPILNVIPTLQVGRRLGVPVVYEIRAFWEDAAVDHGTFAEGSWRYRLIRSAETWACHRANQVAVLCQGIQLDLVKRGIPAEKLTAVRNGVDLEFLTPCPPDEEFRREWSLSGKRVIAFIGSFYRYEGLDLLLQAFAQLANRYPELVLLLVGGGEVDQEVRDQIGREGLGGRVVTPGRIPHERIPGVYALADILVYARRSMRLTELVTPLKPLEAMSMNKPVVASDIAGHRELIRDGETGLLFEPGNPEALAKSVSSLLDDPARCERMARQGRDHVIQEHSWVKTTSVYEAIYAQVLERSESCPTPENVTLDS